MDSRLVNFLLQLCCFYRFVLSHFLCRSSLLSFGRLQKEVGRTEREAGQRQMNRRKEVKPTQRSRLDKTLGEERSREKDSGKSESDSGLSRVTKSRREQWSEEAECGDILGSVDGEEMSKNRTKDRDAKEEAEEAPSGAGRAATVDVASLMQMWMEESRRRDEDNRRKEENLDVGKMRGRRS